MNAEHHLGEAENRLWIVDTDAVATGQRELEPAAEAIAVDCGDGGAGQSLQALQDRVRGPHEGQRFLGRADLRELPDVRASDEARLRGRDHEAARRLALELGEPRVERLQHLAGQRVRSGIGAIERQPRDAVGIDGRATSAGRCPRGNPAAQAAARSVPSTTRKSQISGRWSEKVTSGTSNESISMPRE